MAEMIIDLSNYKDRFGSRVAEGTYTVQVEDIENDTSKAGNAMLIVHLRVIGGEHDGANLVDRLTLSEKALFRVVAFLNGMGIKTPRKKIKIDPARIIGRKVQVDVADGEPFNGNVRSEVKSYMRIAKAAATEETDDLEELEAEVEEAEEAAPAKAPRAKATKAKAKPAPEPEDDDDDEDDEPETNDDGEIDLDDLDV